MRITYDPQADAVYIYLIEDKLEVRTENLSDNVNLDIGPGGQLVGIEILDASEVLGHGKVPSVVLENLKAQAA